MWWIPPFLVLSGGIVAGLNFYLSFLAVPFHKLRHGGVPERVPSGLPMLGSLLLVVGAVLAGPGALRIGALLLLAIDTGGPHWFVGTVAWHYLAGRPGRG